MGENSWNGYEHNCFFDNVGDGQFVDIARPTHTDGTKDGRGVAIADLDRDGRLDLAINNNNASPTIYLNRTRAAGNWLRLELVGRQSNRDAIGARVRLALASGEVLTRFVEAGSGYAAQSDFPLHFGLGDNTMIKEIEINWPSGRIERIDATSHSINQTLRLEESAG